MKLKILTMSLLVCLCGTTYANDCEIKLSPGTTVESIGKITCQKSVEVVVPKKEEKKEISKDTTLKVVKTYEVKKGQGIAQTLKNKHPELSYNQANDLALKVAKDLKLAVTKTAKNEYVVTVQPGFKFALMSDGNYQKQ